MTTTALSMRAVPENGVVSEDVMRELFNLSSVDRPFVDSIGSTTAGNTKKEFTDKVLAAASSTNSYWERADLTAVDDAGEGLRYGNWCQHMIKVPYVSARGRAVDTTYGNDEWLQQVMDLQKELKRDEEAAAVSRNPATEEVVTTTAPLMAGACTWAIHNTQRGAGAVDAVLTGTTGGTPETAPTAGTLRVMTETMLKAGLRGLYDDGADPTHVMSTPAMIEVVSDYMFSSSARIATMTSEVSQGNRSGAGAGNGAQAGGVTAQGAVNMYVGNFGTVTLTPNRFFHTYTSAAGSAGDATELLIFDKDYGSMAYLQDYRTSPLPTPTLGDQAAINVDVAFVPEATHAYTVIADLNHAAPMTA